MRRSLLAISLATAGLMSCKSTEMSRVKEEVNPGNWSEFETAWQQYEADIPKLHPYALQDRCKPLHFAPEGTPKGVALFFHGFTACPMQFIPFAERLQALGYHVIVPLLPGQGRGPTPVRSSMKVRSAAGKDMSFSAYYGEFLPNEKEVYEKFVNSMNTIVAKAPGRHIVGGLSVGGALTTQAVLLAQENNLGSLYQEALAISPYYGMPGLYLGRKDPKNVFQSILNVIERPIGDAIYQVQRGLARSTESAEVLGQIPVSFGAGCYDSICGDRLPECSSKFKGLQATGGRDAICDFKLSNIAALERQGESIRERVKKLATAEPAWNQTRHQIVGTEYDSSADTAHMIELGNILQQRAGDRVQYCLYTPYKGQKIGHVIFDLTEQPFAPMPWRKSSMDQSIRFLDGGTFFPSTAGSKNPNCTVPYE